MREKNSAEVPDSDEPKSWVQILCRFDQNVCRLLRLLHGLVDNSPTGRIIVLFPASSFSATKSSGLCGWISERLGELCTPSISLLEHDRRSPVRERTAVVFLRVNLGRREPSGFRLAFFELWRVGHSISWDIYFVEMLEKDSADSAQVSDLRRMYKVPSGGRTCAFGIVSRRILPPFSWNRVVWFVPSNAGGCNKGPLQVH